MHGGTVEAHSAGPGTGSEFAIRLPVISSAAREAAPATAAKGVDGRKMQVLVVDDNHDAADSLAALLEIDGFDVARRVRRRQRHRAGGRACAGHDHHGPGHAGHGRLRNGAGRSASVPARSAS